MCVFAWACTLWDTGSGEKLELRLSWRVLESLEFVIWFFGRGPTFPSFLLNMTYHIAEGAQHLESENPGNSLFPAS